MTLFDAFVIYLSAGAPFGVLVFLGHRNGGPYRAIAAAISAIGFWPILAASRLGRAAVKQARIHSRSATNLNPINVSSAAGYIPRSHREIVERFTALSEFANAIPSEPAELFEIAGHANPMLATVCNARRRNSIVINHLAEARRAMDELRGNLEVPAVPEIDNQIRSKPEPAFGSLRA